MPSRDKEIPVDGGGINGGPVGFEPTTNGFPVEVPSLLMKSAAQIQMNSTSILCRKAGLQPGGSRRYSCAREVIAADGLVRVDRERRLAEVGDHPKGHRRG